MERKGQSYEHKVEANSKITLSRMGTSKENPKHGENGVPGHVSMCCPCIEHRRQQNQTHRGFISGSLPVLVSMEMFSNSGHFYKRC